MDKSFSRRNLVPRLGTLTGIPWLLLRLPLHGNRVSGPSPSVASVWPVISAMVATASESFSAC